MQRLYLAALTRRSEHAPGSALPRLAALPPPGARWRVVLPSGKTPRHLCAAAHARLAVLALLGLLAAERGSECGRRWIAAKWSWPAGRSPRPGGTMGVPPKGRAERPAFFAAAILSPSILSSALRLLPFFFAAPKRGGLGTRALPSSLFVPCPAGSAANGTRISDTSPSRIGPDSLSTGVNPAPVGG